MKWSKLKQTIHQFFAESVRDRVDFHLTRYGRGDSKTMSRAWITWDGIQIAEFSTAVWIRNYYSLANEIRSINQTTNFRDPKQKGGYYAAYDEAQQIILKQGIYSCDEFESALKGYLSIDINAALASDNPFLRGFAMLDRRVGKRRLAGTELAQTEPELVALLFRLRCEAEGLHNH